MHAVVATHIPTLSLSPFPLHPQIPILSPSYSPHPSNLLRRPGKRLGNLRLPPQPILPKDLRRHFEPLAAVQQRRPNDNLVAHDGLMVVNMRGAIGAVVAVDGVSCRRFWIRSNGGWEEGPGVWIGAWGMGVSGTMEEQMGVGGSRERSVQRGGMMRISKLRIEGNYRNRPDSHKFQACPW